MVHHASFDYHTGPREHSLAVRIGANPTRVCPEVDVVIREKLLVQTLPLLKQGNALFEVRGRDWQGSPVRSHKDVGFRLQKYLEALLVSDIPADETTILAAVIVYTPISK